ncbi:Protein of unknown function [Microlunatus sagamiharensis]|uniref:DUF2993 domain-containing protein n=1 Tax=Microlunatus sagamiharensis TaxID=546874 RepID=A0A1H2LRB4_9ACTN|nr:DUF2993 domain-containing protein [Microlunatus sagamiharensis]SDU83469.1 Protein of unknown function [Microlunatus sagamiharensis]
MADDVRRRGGWLPAALVVLALLLLTWGADVLARVGAESLVAQDVQAATGVAEEPVVEIDGRFFLPQVVRGAYGRVHVSARGLRNGPLVVESLDADLTDVRVPFHDVLVRDVRAIGVGHSEETAVLTYPALNSYLEATGRPLTVAPGPDGEGVTLTGSVEVLGKQVDASADVTLSVDEGNLQLTPQAVTSGSVLGDAARLLLGQRLSVTVPLGSLPFSQRLTGVRPTADGLVVQAAGDAVVLQP